MSSQTGTAEASAAVGGDRAWEPSDDPMQGVRRVDWTVESYYKAIEAGVFENSEHLELILGEVIEKLSPQSTPPRASVLRCVKAVEEAFDEGHYVQTQMPVGAPSARYAGCAQGRRFR